MDESPEKPLFDISGMSPDDAKDYVFSLATHLKQVEAEIKTIQGEQNRWHERAALADRQNLPELKQQAVDTANGLTSKLAEREAEAQEFRAGLDSLKKQLLLLPMTQRTVNTDALLESITQIAGPLDNVTPATKQAEADEALAALKKKLAEGN
jgi:phage shock protein A